MKIFQGAFLFAFLLLVGFPLARADTFGSGDNVFNIDFVTIGDAGNASDTVTPTPTSAPLPSGSVDYTYRMAKYEISEAIIATANALSAAAGQPLGLDVGVERGPQKPATGLSWFDAARFVNWLNEDQGAPAAYKFDAQNQFQLWAPGDVGYDPRQSVSQHPRTVLYAQRRRMAQGGVLRSRQRPLLALSERQRRTAHRGRKRHRSRYSRLQPRWAG